MFDLHWHAGLPPETWGQMSPRDRNDFVKRTNEKVERESKEKTSGIQQVMKMLGSLGRSGPRSPGR